MTGDGLTTEQRITIILERLAVSTRTGHILWEVKKDGSFVYLPSGAPNCALVAKADGVRVMVTPEWSDLRNVNAGLNKDMVIGDEWPYRDSDDHKRAFSFLWEALLAYPSNHARRSEALISEIIAELDVLEAASEVAPDGE